MRKRKFSGMSLKEAMALIGRDAFVRWNLNAPLRLPSETLLENFRRLEGFDTVGTEAAKLLVADALLTEIIPLHPKLKVWKGEALVSATLTGFADYLITPKYAFVKTPLLCAAEAKRDDFVKGRAQCVAEMAACREANQSDGYDADIFGFVTNGQTWQFYRLDLSNDVFETSEYNTENLPRLLGALDYICGECAKRVPKTI